MKLMGCGHAANGTDRDGNPVCVICVGIVPEAYIVVEAPDLTTRRAKCSNCDRIAHSDATGSGWTELPFFEYKPDAEFDRYYCGCRGWD